MSATMRNLTAAFTTEGTFRMPNLFAGEQDVLTMPMPLAANTAVTKNQVLSLNTSGNLVVLDPTQTDGREIPVAIACEAAASEGSVRNIPVYVAGFFNHEALGWPAGTALDTLAERQAAFRQSSSNINIGSIPTPRAPS